MKKISILGMNEGMIFKMRLEVFFDYACPYCLKGHENLKELIVGYPRIEIQWRPCESHPRPERYGPHSDLCIQGMFFAIDQGVDVMAYHDLMYRAVWIERINIEDVDALSNYVDGLFDPDAFNKALVKGKYLKALREANQYAYQQSEVWAVPAYRMNGRKLDAIEDVGVTKMQLDAFLREGQPY